MAQRNCKQQVLLFSCNCSQGFWTFLNLSFCPEDIILDITSQLIQPLRIHLPPQPSDLDIHLWKAALRDATRSSERCLSMLTSTKKWTTQAIFIILDQLTGYCLALSTRNCPEGMSSSARSWPTTCFRYRSGRFYNLILIVGSRLQDLILVWTWLLLTFREEETMV